MTAVSLSAADADVRLAAPLQVRGVTAPQPRGRPRLAPQGRSASATNAIPRIIGVATQAMRHQSGTLGRKTKRCISHATASTPHTTSAALSAVCATCFMRTG